MASVFLQFAPPEREGFVKLHIYEAPDAVSALVEIEEVTAIGTYPDYIDSYSTDLAASATDWFAIRWEDNKGTLTAMSSRMQGGTTTLVGEVVNRVRQRDLGISENIARQEAEAAVEQYFGVDPYSVEISDIPAGQQYRTINGLTYLTMARSYLVKASTTKNVQSATLGLVSFRSESGSTQEVDIQALINLANIELGLNTSIVLQMEDICRNPNWVNLLEP